MVFVLILQLDLLRGAPSELKQFSQIELREESGEFGGLFVMQIHDDLDGLFPSPFEDKGVNEDDLFPRSFQQR